MLTAQEVEVVAAQPKAFRHTRLIYESLANRPVLSCVFVMAVTLALRAALLPWMPVPAPNIHDEFSYLVASDTYAHGRLANPSHPFWQHFETFQVMQQPTYASKYQPLQGMVLAFGQKVFGEPWAGVFLSTGLTCAVFCWMLQAWIEPNWALLGSLLFALRVGVLSYWMNSYEGGAVPAIGGALALGALARIWFRNRFSYAITWAVGISILSLSRPYDAAVVGISTGLILAWRLRTGAPFKKLAPALAVLIVCALALAYNNYRLTGSALKLPYQVHDSQYAVASMFTMIPLRAEPVYRHPVMRAFWAGWNVGQWKDARDKPFLAIAVKALTLLDFFLGFWPVSILLLAWPFELGSMEEKATLIFLGICALMILPLIAVLPHYVAAFSGVIYLRFLYALRRLLSWNPFSRPIGAVLAVAVAVLWGTAFCNSAMGMIVKGDELLKFPSGRDGISRGLAFRSRLFGGARESVKQTLERIPGRHLVLVRYSPNHELQEEWVYNTADIDASPIVWAREMTQEQDRPFLEYFHDRQAWLLEPDQSPPRLRPYAEAQR